MNPIHVLAFVADPLSAPPHGWSPRLGLDYEVRQIRKKLRAAEYRDEVTFDVRWAARTDDLLQGLNETHPQIVHFSGHGGSDGLLLVGKAGEPHPVGGAALAHLFTNFRETVRVVVLNVCFSLPQAQAIAGAVGCAIGTRDEITDEAAITFGASFYRAIAFGHSVQAAFEQARAALALDHHDDREYPELVARPGVDPSRLVLVRGLRGRPAHKPHSPLPEKKKRGPDGPRRGGNDLWRRLHSLLVWLYPSGPREDRVWERAGGDASRLPPATSARAAWHEAISLIRRGEGGATIESLQREVSRDHPLKTDLLRVADQVRRR